MRLNPIKHKQRIISPNKPKHHMNKLALFSFIAVGSALNVQAFTDDFNRANVANTNDGALIGPGWVIGTATNEWNITDNTLHKNTDNSGGSGQTGNTAIWNTSFDMLNGGTITGEVAFNITAGVRGGIAFNIQDNDNLYMFRAQSNSTAWDIFKRESGGFTKLADGNASAAFDDGIFYTFSVTNTNALTNNINYSLTGSNITSINGTITDTTFTDGYGGFWAGNNNVNSDAYTYDNFSAIPEPGTYSIIGSLAVLGFVMIRRRQAGK